MRRRYSPSFYENRRYKHILYVELPGDIGQNPEAFERVVEAMCEAGAGYCSINHPLDRDPVCGYVGVIGDRCPRCGRKEGEAISEEKLMSLLAHKLPSEYAGVSSSQAEFDATTINTF